MAKETRILYLDRLRVFSILLGMLLHVAAAFWGYVPLDSGKFVALSVFNGLSHVCVPLLVMVTGALLLGRADDRPIWQQVRGRISRIALALAFWTLAYALIRSAIQGLSIGFGRELITYFFNCIKQPMHFWYLYMLLGLYLIIPILQVIVKQEQRTVYFLVLAFLISCVLPFVFDTVGFSQQGSLRLEYLSFVAGYSGYCVLGRYLSQCDHDKGFIRTVIVLGLLSLLLICVGTVIIARKFGISDCLFDYFSPLIWMGSSAVFLLFRRFGDAAPKTEKHRALENRLNESSFGMYLVHMFFNEALILLGLTAQRFPALIAVPILTAVVFIGSYVAVRILRRIPVFRNHFL